EKNVIDEMNESKEQIEKLSIEASCFEREGKLDKVAEILYCKIPELQNKTVDIDEKLNNMQDGNRMLRQEVTEQDIAKVVSKWTGVPLNKLSSSESEKSVHLEEELKKRVIGQDSAVKAVSNVIRRSKANISEEYRPIGSF